MKTAKIILLIAAIVIFIAHLTHVNYQDLSWSINAGSYLGMLGMIFIAIAMLLPKPKNT